jgi:aspartate/tyrosine/aromatic aminotransferase
LVGAGNHNAIFSNESFTVNEYSYYYPPTRGLDLEGMLRDISAAPNGSMILLHACAHNPTGVDPSIDEWQQILRVIQVCW